MSIKNRIGKTPIVRALNLEKKLGVKKIYLKLEGNNPCGTRIDRFSILLLKDVKSQNKKTICLFGHVALAKSLAVLSTLHDVNCVFVFEDIKSIEDIEAFYQSNVKIIECKENLSKFCENESKKNNWYNVNPNYQNSMLNIMALSKIASEISSKIKKNISNVYIQTSTGYGLSGIHLGFRELWIDEKIEKMPKLYSCTCESGNALYNEYFKNDFKKNSKNFKEEIENYNESKYNKYVFSPETNYIKNALEAIYDTGGTVRGISDEELEKYMEIFTSVEDNISVTIENGYSIAAFIRDATEGKLSNGNHIIVLNDGRLDMDIEEIEKNQADVTEIVECVQHWLVEFKDSKEEIEEGVKSADKNGHILLARQNDELIGIAVMINLGYEKFIPKYHLGYIVAKNGEEGKGIATELLNQAIEISDGNLSLHVEKNNERAINVYEKMGFYRAYVRMIYKE